MWPPQKMQTKAAVSPKNREMNTKKFCETLYASCDGAVVRRRKSILIPALIIVVGIVLPLLGSLLGDGAVSDTLHSALVIAGIGIALTGAVLLLGRLAGDGEPYHLERKCFLRRRTLSYDRNLRGKVLDALGKGGYKAFMALPTDDASGLTVLVYDLPDGSFAAAQAFEYAELEYRPIGSVMMLK